MSKLLLFEDPSGDKSARRNVGDVGPNPRSSLALNQKLLICVSCEEEAWQGPPMNRIKVPLNLGDLLRGDPEDCGTGIRVMDQG
ncbi:hypothetical protein AAFF_G00155300 [Aldrovandia affinis]|uniref:Uncharacterized protein n=1 Tax=Aldrovandia affinis TaxID=143900 RepID=A0AAD7T129_9TELE|nr:hypothetical protein AAFF_G00155300 [Aldrovandia affinis]